MTDIIKTYQSLEERFPMEEMRRLYLANFGETVDGRLRLYGDWEISDRGALTTAEGEVLPFITLYCWFTFTEMIGRRAQTYGVSCSVDLTTYDGLQGTYFRPLSPFTAEAKGYRVDYVHTNHENPPGGSGTTTRDFTKRLPG
ncbi:hypothetical protein [Serratia rubidaea]|uniref:Uncharacterized protein n=1 Tax=Serratia rubidaea TaxID=61652 RepID=A0A448S8F6_SERRU|nr:hypothetical protein [Serratia rubidaea]MBH1931723.1 hypothetical protein [Serratia rubidaea]MDC6116876.1 hypothetical protein [Serratia rubidaea]MEB7587928.1 hypothetical protein [Serratia rubidaea]VEI63995.1 Uncharacterised protein [Serratia rubidaea]